MNATMQEALSDAVNAAFETEQVPFLAALVEQPSCTREPRDVEVAAGLLDARADELGLTVQRVADPEGHFADHRLYGTAATGDARSVGLIGHIDTVFPRSAGFFGFRREGDTAHGPGVLDMKSGLSSMMFALEAIRRVRGELDFPLRIVVDTDEEVGSPSGRALLAEVAPKLTAALVFEAGRAHDQLVTRRKGTGTFYIHAEGRAAHAGLAHADGVNAIEALARVIPKVHDLTDYDRGLTFNVGLIEGGTSSNTVAPKAHCTIDARYLEPDDAERGAAALERAVGEMALDGRLAGARLTLKGRYHRPPMQQTEASLALLARYGAHARRIGLSDEAAPLQGGGSDANLVASFGVPCLDGLGPAGSGIHRTDERCSLDSLRRRTIALAQFLVAEALDG